MHEIFGPPLHEAVQNGHTEVSALLIDRGANIEAVSRSGMRALHYACDVKIENIGMVEMLLRRNAKVDARYYYVTGRSSISKTALHFSVMKGFYGTTKLLLDHGADSLARNHNNRTPEILVNRPVKDGALKTSLINLLRRRYPRAPQVFRSR